MSLQEQIKADMVAAMKAKEAVRLRVLRSLVTLFTQELTATKRTPQDTLEDDEVIMLIKRSLKQRKEAADQYRKGNREDLAHIEEEEALVLEAYMPEMASREEVAAVVDQKITELEVQDKSQMGKLMGVVMASFNGNADGTMVKEIIEDKLS